MYFFTGLTLLGVIGDITLKLSRGVLMDDLCAKHCYASAYVHSSYILVCDIESLESHAMEMMVL